MSLRGSFSRFIFVAATVCAAFPASAITFSATQDADAVTGPGFDNSNFGGSSWICENYGGAVTVRGFI